MKKTFALLLVLAGVLAILDNLRLFSIAHLMDYLWPSFLILLGLSGLFSKPKNITFSGILVVVGAIFLARNTGLFGYFDIGDILFPAILIVIGLSLLLPKASGSKIHYEFHHDGHKRNFNDSNRHEYNAVLSGLTERVVSNDFEHISITAVLGGAEIDLRDVQFRGDVASVEVTAVMGGVELYIPKDVKLVIEGTPILGGFENHLESNPNASKTLEIHYAVVMGGIELKR